MMTTFWRYCNFDAFALVFNREEAELLIFTTDYKWKKAHYDFKIDINPDFAHEIDETLVLIATYSVLYLTMVQAAATS